MVIGNTTQIFSSIKASENVRYFLHKNDPMSLAKVNLSLCGGKGVPVYWFNNFLVAAHSLR